MNIYDISKEAGVSIATVSRVLNGSGKVSAKTRDRVLRVIRENNYTPNAFARGLGLGTMRTVGILCSDVSDLYLSEAVYHIERTLRAYEYDSLLCCTGFELSAKKKYLKLLLSKNVDAVIFIGSQYVEEDPADNDYIKEAAETVPVFIMNGYIDAKNVYCALCDEYKATFDLTEKLIGSGVREPVFLYRVNSESTRVKIRGIKDACAKAGINFGEERVTVCPKGVYPCAEALEELSETLSFDCALCADDLIAVSVLKYAAAKGLRVPRDVRVCGYNDSILAFSTSPELTSVDNKMFALCRLTADNVINKLSGENISPKTVVSADIIERQST
ncbi:MAG: LacI family DNA-binding transcriptional regulator [Clostridia bacterium]|nr:LacI family DNA-binding transcriptional regulator [Clostridia bacterium]